MARKIILDANVIIALDKGNRLVARELRRLLAMGAQIYVARMAGEELTGVGKKAGGKFGPSSPQTAAATRLLLENLGIPVAPLDSGFAGRVQLYADNFLREKGLIRDFTDIVVVVQAKMMGAEVWTFEQNIIDNAPALGVQVAPESRTTFIDDALLGKPDWRRGRKLMGLRGQYYVLPDGVVIRLPPRAPGRPSPPGDGAGGMPPGVAAPGGAPGGEPGSGALGTGPVEMKPRQTAGMLLNDDAAELALAGVNFIVQNINDREQAKRVRERWARIKPGVEARLKADPSLGVLVMIRSARRQKFGQENWSPLEHTSVFMSIEVAYGATESEAIEHYNLQARLVADRAQPLNPGLGTETTVQRFFYEPRQPLDPRKLRPPFPAYAIGTFAPGRAGLMRVSWNNVSGFDDDGDIALPAAEASGARFLLLIAPSTLSWRHGQIYMTTDIALDWADAASASVHTSRMVSVVDMDWGVLPWEHDTAAPVFPMDRTTERLFFTAGGATRDNSGRLTDLININRLRWVRPENIHVLQKFMVDHEIGRSDRLTKVVEFAKEPALMTGPRRP